MTDADATCPVHADLATFSIVASQELPHEFASCPHCVGSLRALRELRALGESMVSTPPDADRAARVRAQVVRSLSSRAGGGARRFRWRLVPTSIAMAAAFSAVLWAFVATRREHRRNAVTVPTDVSLAVVRQMGAARFERTGKAPDEVVRLEEGQLHVSVAHLGPTERFRITTGDAVVEVRGTEFDVEASHGHLEAVAVQRGRVEVRVETKEPALVIEGGRWLATGSAPTPPPVPAPTPAPARAAHAAAPAVHRKDGAATPRPAAASESAAAKVPSSPVWAPSPREQIPAARDVNLPAAPPTPVVSAAPKPPEVSGAESRRREREDDRSERRERRSERRMEHLEHRR
jgi:hypothetical protein